MELEKLYNEVSDTIAKLDFSKIWPGFRPLRFALFDNEKCYFAGSYIPKTEAFCANTSIVYDGEQIATWMVAEELETPVLASKLVHEMFHGFQTQSGWDCWPDDIEALFLYEYDAENLALKLRENELLLSLLNGFEGETMSELLSIRKLRSIEFPYQFKYELQTEEIEGCANYVEWQVLKQLDPQRAEALAESMRDTVTKAERLMPIRISCYFTGALMIHALREAGEYSFDPPERPLLLQILKDIEPRSSDVDGMEGLVREASSATAAYNADTDAMIRAALDKNDVALTGPKELGFVNIYNARYRSGFLTSTFFLLYREDGQDRMLPGDLVIKMRDEKTIDTVYRM